MWLAETDKGTWQVKCIRGASLAYAPAGSKLEFEVIKEFPTHAEASGYLLRVYAGAP